MDTPLGGQRMSTHPIEGDDLIQDLPGLPGNAPRCTAKAKSTGGRCNNPAIFGGTVCRLHGGSAPQVKAKAQERLMALQFPALAKLGALLERDEFPSVQFQAAKDILDRTMGKPTNSVAVTGADSGPIQFTWLAPWRTKPEAE
jgi:hypothetical protein